MTLRVETLQPSRNSLIIRRSSAMSTDLTASLIQIQLSTIQLYVMSMTAVLTSCLIYTLALLEYVHLICVCATAIC